MSSDDEYWENYDTCPDGFCRHWSCNSDCDEVCARCGHRCPRHGTAEGATSCEKCDCAAWAEAGTLTADAAGRPPEDPQ